MDVEFTAKQLDRLGQALPYTSTFARQGPLEWWTFHLPQVFLVVRLHYGKRYWREPIPIYLRHLGSFTAQLERHALSTNQPHFESPRTEIALEELTLPEVLEILEGYSAQRKAA